MIDLMTDDIPKDSPLEVFDILNFILVLRASWPSKPINSFLFNLGDISVGEEDGPCQQASSNGSLKYLHLDDNLSRSNSTKFRNHCMIIIILIIMKSILNSWHTPYFACTARLWWDIHLCNQGFHPCCHTTPTAAATAQRWLRHWTESQSDQITLLQWQKHVRYILQETAPTSCDCVIHIHTCGRKSPTTTALSLERKKQSCDTLSNNLQSCTYLVSDRMDCIRPLIASVERFREIHSWKRRFRWDRDVWGVQERSY